MPISLTLLLDTHIWVWFLEGDTGRMAPALVPLLERSARSGELRVLDISYWEVAVKAAADDAEAGDTVLLSPACASFDQFKDFEERGDKFRELVGAL